MKALIGFLLIFTCMKVIVAKPQLLQQQQPQYHLDPINEPQFEYPPKDPGKRTIGGRHYALGKHIGIHPHGYKYVLGYSPINIKYVPVVKPVTVLKPVLHQNIRQLWKPVLPPIRQYLPHPGLHISKPVHEIDHGWKPVGPPIHQHEVHEVVEQPHLLPALPAPLPPVQSIKPIVPGHNYFFFQTPVAAKPALLPQVPLFHVARPHLNVLPLGASFPAPILQNTGFGAPVGYPFQFQVPVHPPPVLPVQHPVGIHPQPALPAIPAHHHPHFVPDHHLQPAYPVHRPMVVHPQPAQPVLPAIPAHHHFIPQSAPPPGPAVHVHPQPGALPPISVEFHGNRHLVPFNNQFPFTSVQAPVPLPKMPEQTPQVVVGRQPHALPLPTQDIPEIQHFQPFNPEAAIQPGQTDLQFPLHLPDHPYFRSHNHFQPTGSLEPPFPPFQNPGNILRPSISLEPPLTHGHS